MDDLEYTRFLISDTASDPDRRCFSDVEIQAVLDRELSLKHSAALLLERIADNETLTLKYLRTQDVTTDGPRVAADLRASARQLRSEADQEALTAASSDAETVEYVPLGYQPLSSYVWH